MQQILQFTNPFTGLTAPTSITQNVAASKAEGAEITVTGRPTDVFSFNVGVGILDTGYEEIGPGVMSVTLDDKFGRGPIPVQPRWTVGYQRRKRRRVDGAL